MQNDWQERTFRSSLEQSCERFSSRSAIQWGESLWTYEDLLTQVRELESGFRSIGIAKGDRVALLMGATPQWVLTFYALARIGAVSVPINTTWIGAEIESGLQLTDAQALIIQDSFRGVEILDLFTSQFPDIERQDRTAISVKKLPHLRNIIISGSTEDPPRQTEFAYDLKQLRIRGAQKLDLSLVDVEELPQEQDHAMYLLTSGSTKFPKPVIHTNASLLFAFSSLADAGEVEADEIWLLTGTTYHISSYLALVLPLMRGATVILTEFFETSQSMALIESHKVTSLWGFDTHFIGMIRHTDWNNYDLSSVRKIWLGSNPASFEEIRKFGAEWHGNIYGNTETAACGAFFPYSQRADVRRMKFSHGLPVRESSAIIVDPGTGSEVDRGTRGEICISGPQVFSGYYNMPEETAKAFLRPGVHRTGDLGWIDEDGFVYYIGRYKEMLKTGGENVSVAEVEQAVEIAVPGVSKAIIVGVPDERWGEMIVVFISWADGKGMELEEFRAYCKRAMANYKIPKHVLRVGEHDWPITPTGKYNRKELRTRAAEQLGIVLEINDPVNSQP